jgi:DNA (cytosine-5)-methyltransferase 1
MPLLLDLFCGAGGAAEGYVRAGFEVVGVDIVRQPHFPYAFRQGDALNPSDWLEATNGRMPDAIHASPPCQAFTAAQVIRGRTHPNLIDPLRSMLIASGLPWVIENVPGSPLIDPVTLCGLMFGLDVDRDRLFESNITLTQPDHPAHDRPKAKMGRPPKDGDIIQVVGNFSGVAYARRAMGIDWMMRNELREAIPPAYTEYVGKQILETL